MKKIVLKCSLVVACIFINMHALWAKNGIDAATNEVKSYFDPATKLMYAVGAVLGIIGGVKVYSKWNQGDPDTTKVAASWFGSCIFLVIVATILRGFFM